VIKGERATMASHCVGLPMTLIYSDPNAC